MTSLPKHVYAAALAPELTDLGLQVRREVAADVRYVGRPLYALRQPFNYLRCSEHRVGLLLHFGPTPVARRLDYRPGQPSRPSRAAE